MGTIRAVLCVLAVTALSCAESDEPLRARSRGAQELAGPAGQARKEKPGAPIAVALTAERLPGSDYRIRIEGTPEVDVESVLLELLLPDNATFLRGTERARFATTSAGATRGLVAEIRVRGPGAQVLASARVRITDGIEPNRMAEIVLGTPPAAKPVPVHTITLPSGERIDEVGP